MGESYQAQSVDGRLDLGGAAEWQALAAYTRSDILFTGGSAAAYETLLGAGRRFSPSLDASAELAFGGESSGSISFFGPSLKAYYSFLPGAGGDEGLDREIEDALNDASSPAPYEAFSLFGGLDVLAYSVATGGVPGRRVNHAGKTITTQTPGAAVRLTQVCPSAGLDIPLWPGLLRASISGNYYLYAQDPWPAAGEVNQFYSANPGKPRAGSLVSGLLASSWQAGLDLRLPLQMTLGASYGRQLPLDAPQWVDIYGARLSKNFSSRLRADLGGSYSIDQGAGRLLASAGLRLRF